MAADCLDLSVVVCTRNGERRLSGALAHLRRQSLDASRYEVIVVDDGSADGSARLAEAYGARVVRLERSRGLAAARNAGVSMARGRLVAFTDDDCDPAEGWLEALLGAFVDPAVDGVGGLVVPECTDPFLLGYLRARNPLAPMALELLTSRGWTSRLRRYLRGVLGRNREPSAGCELYSVVGANMALRRELLERLGGFDEAIRFGGEEEDLCRRAHARPQGALFRYAPAAVVKHRFTPSLGDSLRRARAYGRGHPYAASTHADMKLIVYPFPIAIALAALVLASSGRPRRLWRLVLAPVAVYARWPREAWRSGSPTPLLYAYLELGEEVATMIGELEGLHAPRAGR